MRRRNIGRAAIEVRGEGTRLHRGKLVVEHGFSPSDFCKVLSAWNRLVAELEDGLKHLSSAAELASSKPKSSQEKNLFQFNQ
ncbi:hypothetical protein NECAME_14521 [Necator americanus]|uniref:Uncharacterized protein n=1 Tax=Necator americanus TaxID=51031 RepID=W2SMT6_NECAM|nr:hypothetical protein NECAME_14521 [Necator americanus]ETN70813.1 hypothetical protein NECAME_14521 [Necator americanus]